MYTLHDFMNITIAEAKLSLESNDIPIGTIIVKDNNIIAKAHNQVEKLKNPIAHSEIIAINEAINKLGTKYLYDCDMYVNLEPCIMCAGAIVLARIKRIYIGTENTQTGACGSLYNILQEKQLNHYTEIYNGIAKEECSKLISNFFQDLRKKANKCQK